MMTATVVELPTIRLARNRAGTSEHLALGFRVELEHFFFDKLTIAAERAGCSVGDMGAALILHGLAAVEKTTVGDLIAQARAADPA